MTKQRGGIAARRPVVQDGGRMRAQGSLRFQLNYTLYADIELRIVSVYNRLCPEVEVYSIDECFLYFPDWKCPDYPGIAHRIRNTVYRETGIPVS